MVNKIVAEMFQRVLSKAKLAKYHNLTRGHGAISKGKIRWLHLMSDIGQALE